MLGSAFQPLVSLAVAVILYDSGLALQWGKVRAFRTAGLDVLMWGSSEEERTRIRDASFELAPGEQLASAASEGSKVEGVNTILLLTEEDDFNALAASNLAGDPETPVYRLAPRHSSHGAVAPYIAAETLFAPRT